jgi:hypothetical protein
MDGEEQAEEDEEDEEEDEDVEEEEEGEEVLTLTTFLALLCSLGLNSALVVNADACDARERDEGASRIFLSCGAASG